jgi:hypothetical protein
MHIAQALLRAHPATGFAELQPLSALQPDLVLVFGSVEMISDAALATALRDHFPAAARIGCSTAGEIYGAQVGDGTAVVSAIRFEQAQVCEAATELRGMADSRSAGERLGAALAHPGLKAVLVFGQGVAINGSALVAGLSAQVGKQVAISGGLAGDGAAFQRTWTLNGQGASSERIVAVGLSGATLRVAHGCFGGWQAFGPSRKVTRCAGNMLYELDGEPALAVYKRYLGDYARALPASGLLFPLEILDHERRAHHGLIRTILAVDEATGSLTLAGEIEAGSYLRLMHAHTDALVDGAELAATQAAQQWRALGARRAGAHRPSAYLSLLVSCVGRKLVMGGRVDEEVEAVAAVLGAHATLAGFYSNGEISPARQGAGSALHNQTMTLTCIGEDHHD